MRLIGSKIYQPLNDNNQNNWDYQIPPKRNRLFNLMPKINSLQFVSAVRRILQIGSRILHPKGDHHSFSTRSRKS